MSSMFVGYATSMLVVLWLHDQYKYVYSTVNQQPGIINIVVM